MADDVAPTEDAVVARRPLWQRILKWIAITIAVLLLLLVGIVFGLNTDPGRRFIATQLGGYTTASGLNIKVGRIDGSIYGGMMLSDVQVSDPKGVFLTSPRLDIDWRPFAYVNNHVDVRALTAGLVTLRRNPELKSVPSDPNAPTLPDIDIDVNRLRVDRFVMMPPVAGKTYVGRISGSAHIADRRAQLLVDAAALRGAGVAGGDMLKLRLDAVPDDDKLDLDARLTAPVGGLVASLGGLKAPLVVTIGGKGAWSKWNGKAVATLGGASFADLALAARNGTFQVRGMTHPGVYLQGPVERLTAPGLQVAIDTTLNERRADTRINLKSDALAVAAQGLVDLGNSRFANFKVDAQLLTPGAIAPNLKGRSVRAVLALDGAFAQPTVDYKISAAAIGFNDMTVEQVYAEGLARVDSARILIPIKARARRVTGLNAAAGGLLTNVAINGDLAIDGTNILSDNLRIRSDKIDATAVIAANVSTGRYVGALKGRINDYRIDSIGIVNLVTDAKLVTTPNGGFGIQGRVVARTSQIFNAGAKTFLGGNAIVRADVGYDPAGVVTFRNVRLNAPKFRVTSGEGRYTLNGGLVVSATAYSAQYGPIVARVTGSVVNPVVDLRLARPGFGVGLANLRARIVGRGGAYAVVASGGTNYGPFTADVVVTPGAQLAINLRRVVFAGINFTGRVVQTAGGPFAGRVQFAGSGLSGAAQLANQGGYQRADLNARAYGATIPGAVDFTIGRAIVTASVVLVPNAPQLVADAQIADMRYGPTVISAARAKVNYVAGRGTAQALLTGSNGVPFRLALNAKLAPNDYLAALQGQANGINFRTGNPAHVIASRGTYTLAPTRIVFDKGQARIAGSYGKTLAAQMRLDSLDLSILNALIPNLGIGGQATGSVDFRQGAGNAIPTADARVTVRNFTRSSIAAVSQPVDIVFAGRLVSDGGEARALVKRGPNTIGRMVATLRPLPPGAGSWSTRLLSAPLSGGIRYNGPSGVLLSFAALRGQQLSGPIAIAADFSGRANAPQLNGLIRADNLTYDNETYGTRLTNLQIAARFTNDRLELTRLQAKAGDGTIAAQGTVGLAAASGFPISLQAQLRNARLAKSDALGATATGDIALTYGPQGGLIRGDLTIPNARYAIIKQGAAEVPELTGVRRKSDIRLARPTDRPKAASAGLFKIDLRVRAPNKLYVSGMGLESEWSMDLRIAGTSAAPVIEGGLDLVRGTFSFAGKPFEVNRGAIRFRGGALSDPDLNIQATTTTDGITAVINITGTGQRPQIAFTSTPTLPQDQVLSRLLFGTNPENLSAIEAIQLAAALNSLRPSGGGGLNPLGKLRSATGFDRLRILGADEATGRGTSLAAGKYITDDIYIEIITDSRGFTATQLTIALTKAISVLSQAGSFGGSNVSVKYSRDF